MGLSLSGQVRVETKGFCVRPSPPRTWIHGDWYTDPSLPAPWSTETDWADWDGLRLFEQTIDGEPKIEKLFKDVFAVPGTAEPLAYVAATGSELYVLKSCLKPGAATYYLWSDGASPSIAWGLRRPQIFWIIHYCKRTRTICRT
jgi:hypothetical protein